MHIPVLQKEVIEYLDPKPNENFIDATFGFGGHSKEILKRNAPRGKVLGIELDPAIIKCLTPDVKHHKRLILVNDSYSNLKEIVEKYNFRPINGILFDLGMSSWHLEKSGRGFSFQKDEPLDMRYNSLLLRSSRPIRKRRKERRLREKGLRAGEILNKFPEKEIERILREYGQERFAKKIAKKIIEERKAKPIQTTFQLVEIVKRAIPKRYQNQRIHPATRTFQALRIAVNDELENLRKALSQTLEVLKRGGRIVIISFHSLEDRIVKNFFRENSRKNILKVLTKKPITPSREEIQKNLRSRGAKLRAAIKL